MALSIKAGQTPEGAKEMAQARERAKKARPTLGDVVGEGLKQKGRKPKKEKAAKESDA